MRTKSCLVIAFLISPLIRTHAQGIWTQKSDLGGPPRTVAVAFVIGDKGYVGTGVGWTDAGDGVGTSSFREYDPATDTWTRKAHVPGPPEARVASAAAFSIGSKGYIGTGARGTGDDAHVRDFLEYDPVTDRWTRKADFGGIGRSGAVGLSIGDKGYIGLGGTVINGGAAFLSDFWEYDPATDTWTQKADFPGNKTSGAVAFSIGNKGYVGTGVSRGGWQKDFWEYDPAIDVWTQKADYGGEAISFGVGFAINGKGYIGVGTDSGSSFYSGFWEYDPTLDLWTQVADFPGIARSGAVAFAIGDHGYLGTGAHFYPIAFKDFWQFTPQ